MRLLATDEQWEGDIAVLLAMSVVRQFLREDGHGPGSPCGCKYCRWVTMVEGDPVQ